MIHSTATVILPHIENNAVYDMFDHKPIRSPPIRRLRTATTSRHRPAACSTLVEGAQLRRSRPSRPGKSPRKPKSTPSFVPQLRFRISNAIRCIVMAASITWCSPSRMSTPPQALRRTACEPPRPARRNGWPRWSLRCSIATAAASTSHRRNQHTILWIEDAGRAHPDVSVHGAFSTRFTPVSGAADPINMSCGAKRAARVCLGRCRRS